MTHRLSPDDIVAGVRELPALPEVVMELIAMMGNDDISVDQLARRISRDPALVAKTLRLANSPFYGMSRTVSSVSEATTVLGLRMLRSIAMAAGLAGSFSPASCKALDFQAFWRHSIGTALCAQALAQALRQDAETAFTLGMLHDIGRLLLASRFPEAYDEVRRAQRDNELPQHEAEAEVLGIDHAAIGACITDHWRFAPEFVQAIVDHHAPAHACAGDLLHVADNMAHALDLAGEHDAMVPPLSLSAWQRLHLEDDVYLAMFGRVEGQHQALCDALAM